ncbi:probable potassium transporter 13 [Durio zibethinus]|uniref:Potassium transporter n=1 Tax=Durio zibethinus TaxID=66656 RepID=A0A6P5WQ07_DURZI|nr:probable potassium transporter 13 [Durio zibethinus]
MSMESETGSTTQVSRLKLYRTTISLAYQSFGVVYGDLCISPIYVFKSIFSGSLLPYREDHEILGVLSLILWTLTIIPLLKYAVFVLCADDNGEGGTFALYSLLCRHSRMGLLNTTNVADEHVSIDKAEEPVNDTRSSILIKQFFEKYHSSRVVLLLVVLLGSSMVIGDGILSPTMSVLSAVYGLQIKVTYLHENHIVFFACILLVGHFALQHYGTHNVGFLFAPILLGWLICITGVGIYNVFHWNPRVLCAVSPYHIYNFFNKAGKDAWSSLGGIVLCITGAEAMFADLGHFSQLSVRIGFTAVVYPCLVLAYMGEAAYLSKHRMNLQSSFYKAIPDAVFWPVFIIATLASVVGSQAIISATFSIISQCRALSCFPRVKIIHTSNQIHGQIYLPEINWMLMLLCLAVVIGFRDIHMIGNAYGLAVITVMFVTTCLMFLIIITVWNRSVFLALLFVLTFGSLELLYFSACLAKVHKGGWLPLLISAVILSLMSIWHYGTSKKQSFELENKVSLDSFIAFGPGLGISRIPGIGLIYSNVASGVPPMFAHFVASFPAVHQILIFVTMHYVMIPKVPADKRFLVTRFGPPEFRFYRCIVRFGYKDIGDSHDFETQLIEKVSEFLKHQANSEQFVAIEQSPSPVKDAGAMGYEIVAGGAGQRRKEAGWKMSQSRNEVQELMDAKESGVAYMMANTHIRANGASSFVKKFAINIIYGFLRRNSRRPAIALGIPHTSLVEIGMLYQV